MSGTQEGEAVSRGGGWMHRSSEGSRGPSAPHRQENLFLSAPRLLNSETHFLLSAYFRLPLQLSTMIYEGIKGDSTLYGPERAHLCCDREAQASQKLSSCQRRLVGVEVSRGAIKSWVTSSVTPKGQSLGVSSLLEEAQGPGTAGRAWCLPGAAFHGNLSNTR